MREKEDGVNFFPISFLQVNSSLIFFLFSFQVHEKSILLAVLPSSLLTHHHPNSTVWFQLAALLSMYPLLTKDRLVLACLSLGGLYLSSSIHILPSPTSWPATLLVSVFIHITLLIYSILNLSEVSHTFCPLLRGCVFLSIYRAIMLIGSCP